MTVGGSAPRYQNMAVLYPQSAPLQSHLCEYYIVMVRICHKLIKTLKTPIWRQMGSFLSASEVSGFQSDLDRWSTSIKDEVHILTAQSINEQRAGLGQISRNWAQEQRRRKLTDYHRLLDLCSTYDHQTPWKQLRKIGSTDLFNSLTTYRDWKAASQCSSSMLVCMGKLGSGKSVWLANMVEDLHLTARGDKQSLGYFFCRHDILESLNARAVIGSITRQLLQQHAQGAQFHALDDLPYSPLLDLEDLVNLLRKVVPHSHVIHIVIDGLDECNDFEREKVLRTLTKLQAVRLTHVCLSFRLEADNSTRLNMEAIPNCSTASIPEDNPDIGHFIDAELQVCLETQKLTLGDPALIARIRDVLLQGAQGMFLWVALQITSLCASRTDEGIQGTLENLPRDLPETFSRILQRSKESEDDDLQRRVLGFVITACRPLTTGELREALAVVPGDANWNPGRSINSMYAALACCGCLITVDEEESTIRLVHHSVKTYLTGGSMAPVPMPAASSAMAHAVVTYLNYGVFGKQVSTTAVTPPVSGERVMTNIVSSLDSGVVRTMALSILKSGKSADVDVGSLLRDTTRKFERDAAQPYEFYDYAKAYLSQHLVHVSPLNERVVSLLFKLLAQAENKIASHLIRSESHDELLHALIVRGLDVEVEDDTHLATPLIWAVSRGNVSIVSELIRRGANLEAVVQIKKFDGFYPPHHRVIPKLNQGVTPLLEVAASGQEEIVKILVDSGAKLEVKDSWGYSPLTRAIQAGAKSSIKLLLDRTADMARLDWEIENEDAMRRNHLKVDLSGFSHPSPLKAAVIVGDEETVNQLVDKGSMRQRWKYRNAETPLSLAVSNADHRMIKLLITKGADPSDASSVRFPWLAPEQEKIAVMKMLVENYARVGGSSSIFGPGFLIRAAADGDVAVVKLLLENGANTEYWVEGMGTPLVAAATNGREAVVRFLLDRGADLNSKPNGMTTALMAAAENGHGAVVDELLQAGADPNIRGGLRFRKAKGFAKNDQVRGVFTRHGL
jgi:ankyrin repeat protein